MEQNNNAWAKKQFKLHRNSRMAKQNLTKAKSDFNNGKNKIAYALLFTQEYKKQLIYVIKFLVLTYLTVISFFSIFAYFNAAEVNGILLFLFYSGRVSILYFFFLLIMGYIEAINRRIVVYIDRKKKIIVIKSNGTLYGWKKIQFEWHSNHYLPELSLPETEQEKYKEMQQNLQQAIALETGLKFDTQQFLLQNKGKLGI